MTGNGELVALDVDTGKPVWDTSFGEASRRSDARRAAVLPYTTMRVSPTMADVARKRGSATNERSRTFVAAKTWVRPRTSTGARWWRSASTGRS